MYNVIVWSIYIASYSIYILYLSMNSFKLDRLLEVMMYYSSYSDLPMYLSLLCLVLQGVALLSLKYMWLARIHRYVINYYLMVGRHKCFGLVSLQS